MFEANYSRKLSSLKHRLVTLPPEADKSRGLGFIYWQWAFESPHEVKVLVRKLLGEENTPQGHLRLILLPIVFNAMANNPKLRSVRGAGGVGEAGGGWGDAGGEEGILQ